MTKKTTVKDIIGLVDCEPTNSVEEVRKLRGRDGMTENKRFMVDDCGTLIDIVTRDTFDYVSDVVVLLNALHDDKQTMIKEFAKTIRTYEEWISNLKEENRQLIKKVDMLERIIDGDLE